MKKYILKSLFVSVLCMLAASCQDTDFVETLDSSKAQVMFSVAMDSPAARSRATWGDDYTPSDLGDEYDNRIDLDQFIVKIEAGGKTYNVTDIIKWKEGETNEYKFVGIVKNQNGENVGKVNLPKAKISVYANMGNDANANFATMTFNQDAENIPMWGALTVENLEFAPGKRTNVDDIYLLRAMAKFQVTLGEDAIEKGYTLTKASLNKFNLVGNNMPTGYADATSTMTLGLEDVMNENTSNLAGATELTEATEDGNGWVIYLPEISNTTASELKMLLTFSKEGSEQIETEVSVKDYSTANTGLVNIVRNHWYKYVIEDIVNAKPVVNYKAIDWTSVNINVGGEGFLALSTDLVEIYNANTGQLKFTSSSPITITRADVYEHKNNGEIVKRQEINNVDPVDAYYVNKFGVLTQLPTDESNPESVVLANTSAVVDGEKLDVLKGNIKISTPFIGIENSTNQILKEGSHYNTIRYIEFLVTNEDNLSATFRVMLYPPTIITNKTGYFSYRSDFITRQPNENGIPTNYLYWDDYRLTMSLFNAVHVHSHVNDNNHPNDNIIHGSEDYDWYYFDGVSDDEIYCWGHAFTSDYYWEEIHTGSISYSTVHPVGPIWRYGEKWRLAMKGVGRYAPLMGPIFRGEDGKIYRKHYPGNNFVFFNSKFVDEEVVMNQNNKGKAYICWMTSDNKQKKYVGMGSGADFIGNHRIYQIKTTELSDNYVLGYPTLVDDENVATDSPDTGRTFESENNSRMVSPNFMVASELGNSEFPSDADYAVDGRPAPIEDFLYEHAVKHCKNYVEVRYIDKDNDGKYTADKDEIITYDDWRLPTLAEVNLIAQHQTGSRAMDLVMNGEKYACARPNGYFSDNVGTVAGRHMRCVRDVKEKEND